MPITTNEAFDTKTNIERMLKAPAVSMAGQHTQPLYLKEWTNKPPTSLQEACGHPIFSINLFHHLCETLTFDEKLQKEFYAYAVKHMPWEEIYTDGQWRETINKWLQDHETYYQVCYGTSDTDLIPNDFASLIDRNFEAWVVNDGSDNRYDEFVIMRTHNGNYYDIGFSPPFFFRPRFQRRMIESGFGHEVFDLNRYTVYCNDCDARWDCQPTYGDIEFVPADETTPDMEWKYNESKQYFVCPACSGKLESGY